MRESKYRAWDIQTESMRDVLVIDRVNELIDLSGGIIERRPHEVKIMQYTGLKDKNGVEIYEGDIISELSEQVEDWEKHILAEVVWHKTGFYGKEKGHEPEYPITEFAKGEVIGNIYENQELLATKKTDQPASNQSIEK